MIIFFKYYYKFNFHFNFIYLKNTYYVLIGKVHYEIYYSYIIQTLFNVYAATFKNITVT